LQQSSDTLAVVAERVGYGSEAAFCKAFKRTFGVTPKMARLNAS
jgi:AraC-like DNA-binding protein